MVKLKEIPRTATFAWSPNPHDPLMVTGTVAGAIDADFNATTQLEIWDLDLLDRSNSGFQVQPKKSIDTENRFYDIAWGGVSSSMPMGVIAGALEDGTVQLWDPKSILNGTGGGTGVINKAKRHSGAVKSLQFNPLQNHLFASAGSKGEIYVWDLNKIGSPFTPGNPSSRLDEIDAVAWNNSVAHIMATGGNTGFTSVWDLKNKREVLHLQYSGSGSGAHSGRKGVSSVAWHPDNSTKLMTASSSDSSPVILIWDLRNANAPEQILTGHDQGILSLDWCKYDSNLMLSSGKDNRTILWNPSTAENLGEYQIATNWTFQTRFSPRNPEIFASASFDGKITIQTLQDTSTAQPEGANAGKAESSGEDFWNSTSYVDTQHPTISLKQAPKWLKRPVGARFGFGGKLISIRPTADGGEHHSTIVIGKFVDDESLSAETTKFTEVIKSSDIKALEDICTERATSEELTPLEKHDWKIINLLSKRDNNQIINFLSPATEAEAIEKAEKVETETETKTESETEIEQQDSTIAIDGEASLNDDEFLSSLSISAAATAKLTYAPTGAFSIYGDNEDQSESDKDLTQAILLGQLDKAVEILLKEKRLADAFLVSVNASAESRKKVEIAYILENSSKNFVRVLASVTSNNLEDLVLNGDIEHWKDILASLVSFKINDKPTFNQLATQLGDRLAANINQDNADDELRNSALFCYLISSNLDKITAIWIDEIAIAERNIIATTGVTPYSAHMKALHSFVEKITVYRKVAGEGFTLTAASDSLNGIYREYANEIASRGNLELASIFLELLPSGGDDADISLEKARVSTTAKPSVTTKTTSNYNNLSVGINRIASTSPARGLYQPSSPYGGVPPFPQQQQQQQQQQQRVVPAVNDINAKVNVNPSNSIVNMYNKRTSVYGEPATIASYGAPYGNVAPQQANAAVPPPVNGSSYVPTYGAPVQSSHAPAPINPYQPAAVFSAPVPVAQVPPPPSASGNPVHAKREASGWNDLPTASLGANTSRRQTPAAPVTTASYNYSEAPVASPYVSHGFQPAMASPAIQQSLPPPPGPNQGKPIQAAPIMSSTIPKNPYAPTTNAVSPMNINFNSGISSAVSAPVRSSTPGSSKYAPEVRTAPQPGYPGQQQQQQQQYGSNITPPVPAAAGVYAPVAQAHNPYAPAAGANPVPSPGGYFPNTSYTAPQHVGGINVPPSISAAPPVPERAPSPPPAPKHPAGDRSHVPQEQLPIFEVLSSRLEALKPLVPAAYSKQVKDAEKRLNILFDLLNNEELLSGETINDLLELSACVNEGNWNEAQGIYLNIITTRDHECSQWGTGIKRLIDMCRAVAAQQQQL